jgi:adenosylmethionine-8-amino-7-oxononanoate aminotransferase
MTSVETQTAIVRRARHARAPIVDRGEGIYIYDVEGNRYIDGSSGSSVVVNIGHGVQSVADAMYAQAQKISFAATHVFTSEPLLKLGEMVAERAPGAMRNNCRIWLSNTGTDAVDDAARLARQYYLATGKGTKYLIIGRWQGFHGNNLGVAGFSGHTLRRRLYYPMYVHTPHIPPAYCYRCPFELEYPGCKLKCARALETMINQTGEENVAAFIAEPVVGAALGAVPAPEGYFEVIREICDRHDVLLIADEVMTAWGRLGRWFGIEEWGITPDIIATAKGISSGYTPLAATIAKEEIWGAIEASGASFIAGHTMNANPLSCAVAVANLEYMEAQDVLGNAQAVGPYLLERLRDLLDLAIVGDARGRGLLCGIELVRDKASKAPFDPKQRASHVLEEEALKRGLVLYACTGCIEGVAGDMMLVTPPLIITRPQVDELVGIMREAILATQARLL